MKIIEKFDHAEYTGTNWRRLLMRGGLMLFIGAILALASLIKHDVIILQARDYSWLPICGFVILVVGLLEVLDTYLAKTLADFFLNLQNGVLDVVVASMIILNLGDDPARLGLLITAFLIVRGVFRLSLAHTAQIPQKISTTIGSAITILLGLLIWAQWPTSGVWFFAFSLSVEIGMRGWTLMAFGLWLKRQKES